MCGRFSQSQPTQTYAKTVDPAWQPEPLPLQPTWNLAPSKQAQVFTSDGEQYHAGLMYFGFLPAWAEPTAQRSNNARVETAACKPYFRKAWKTGRCLIPADGWFEWQASLKSKQPFYLYRADHDPILMAGLYETNPHLGITSFAILTTEADGDLRQVHDRKPIVLSADLAKGWMKPDLDQVSVAEVSQSSLSANHFAWHAVSTRVNNARNDGDDLAAPV